MENEHIWKERALSLLHRGSFTVDKNDPDYESWKMRSEYPCWIDGIYFETVSDYISYRNKQHEIENITP